MNWPGGIQRSRIRSVAVSSEAPFGVDSFQFDGVSSRIVIPDDNSLDLSGDLFVRLLSFFYHTDFVI